MALRAPLLAMALAFLATACSEDVPLPPLEEEPPPFAFSLYLEQGGLTPNADVLLVRRPKHLEHVYALSLAPDKPGHGQAKQLFGIIETEFAKTGAYVADRVVSLRCAAVELPDCVPKWSFIDELLGPGDGPGSRRLRQALAGSFEETARQRGMENTLVLATVNVLLTRGMLKSALGNAATAEARATALAEHRAMVERPGGVAPAPRESATRAAAPAPAPAAPAPAPSPLAPSPGLVQALTGKTPTPPVASAPRLPQDAAVSPKVPKLQPVTRPIGPSPSQNAQLQADIQFLETLGAKNIRVNQQQITVRNGQRVGINRPDLQFDYMGRRYHVEYDTPTSGRGSGHQSRITSNDPNAEIILLIVP
jgi:hypothetical protein